MVTFSAFPPVIEVSVPRKAVAKSHAPRRTPKPINDQRRALFADFSLASLPCAPRNWKPAPIIKTEATGMPTLMTRSSVALINFGIVFIPQSGPPPTIKPYDSSAKTKRGTMVKKARTKIYLFFI